MQELLAGSPIPLVTVGFSPAEALGPLADRLGLRGRMLSDPDRDLYRRIGLRRVPIWRIYSPGTLAYYARQVLRGASLPAPVEDTRQLGGDAVCVDGVVTRVWCTRTPTDRPDPVRIVAAAQAIDR